MIVIGTEYSNLHVGVPTEPRTLQLVLKVAGGTFENVSCPALWLARDRCDTKGGRRGVESRDSLPPPLKQSDHYRGSHS